MQEGEQTVTFEPIYEGYLPVCQKLFSIYLLVVLVVLLVRIVRLAWELHKLPKIQEQGEPHRDASTLHWDNCMARAQSFKELAALTFLLSILVLSWSEADILFGIRTEKRVSLAAFVLPATGESLTTFSMGLIVTTVLYSVGLIFQSALRHRRRKVLDGRIGIESH